MKQYTFEISNKVYEFYDMRRMKKSALEFAKQIGEEVLITMQSGNGKIWEYTMFPDGRFTVDGKNLSFNN